MYITSVQMSDDWTVSTNICFPPTALFPLFLSPLGATCLGEDQMCLIGPSVEVEREQVHGCPCLVSHDFSALIP